MFRRFLRDTRGNIAMMFAMVTVPLIAATGAAIDYARAYEQRMVVQDALDSASLAANRLIGLATEEEIFAEAQAFFNVNVAGRLDNEVTLTMVVNGGSVALSTDLPVPTMFLGLIGIDNINFAIRSVSIAGAATYEVVLVLDNSTSMRGTKLSALQTAARDLVNSLFALSVGNGADDPIRIGLVPFAASVNVGANNENAAWMDTTGIGPTAGNNFDHDANDEDALAFEDRFTVFNNLLENGQWYGCVEARPFPHDVTDTTPTPATPATLFQPMFAPDEPDDWNNANDYLDDDGGTCDITEPGEGGGGGAIPWWCSWFPWHEDCSGGGGEPTPAGPDYCDPDAGEYDRCVQERVCKYDGEYLDYNANGMGEGPNLNCTTAAVTPMSDNQNSLTASINAMVADGWTNIAQGIVWGWHLLSEAQPFPEGRAYDEAGNHKILIVMTDGANTYGNYRNNMNKSEYLAFNYIYHNYLGTTSPSQSTIVDQMNDRTIEICSNIHEGTNITVYTIAFQVDDYDAEQILLNCASDPSKAYDAGNNDELIAAFQAIAQDIATLRIAE